MTAPSAFYEERALTEPGSVSFVAGFWSDWFEVAVPSTPRDMVGVAWLSPVASGAQSVQFGVGPAGQEVPLGPEFRHNGAVVNTLRSVLFGRHVPLFTVEPSMRLVVRIKTEFTVVGSLTFWTHYVPVSRP